MANRRPSLAAIEGTRPVIEALRAGRRRVYEVAIPDGDGSPARRELEALVAEHGVRRRTASTGWVVAQADPFPEEEFEALLDSEAPRRLVALDRVTDVGNFGSIARSAEVAGFGGILLEQRRSPPISPAALRASAGALEHLRVGRAPNLGKALELARANGLVVLAADAGGEPLESVPSEAQIGELIWVFGSEDQGLRSGVLARADYRVGIPIAGRTGSLGVAAAAAYLLLRTAELWRGKNHSLEAGERTRSPLAGTD